MSKGPAYFIAVNLMADRKVRHVVVALERTIQDDRVDWHPFVVRVEYDDGRVHSWAPQPLALRVWQAAQNQYGPEVPAPAVSMSRPGSGVRLEQEAAA